MKIIKSLFSAFIIIIFMYTALSAQSYKIVVLPFDKLNKEKNSELETLSVGISETLSGALSTVENFVVIDSNRVKRHLLESAEFKQTIGLESGDIEKLRELTKEKLDADYIVYGSFNKIGKKIQLNAKFMNISTGEVIKGSNVHGQYPDEIFTLQEQLAKDLTGKISGKTTTQQQQNKIEEYSNSTGNYTAYQYYIKGRMEQIQYDVKSYPHAVENYNKALKYDPKYALAWAGLSEVNALWGYQIKYANGKWQPYLKIAIEQGQKAVEYGPNLYQTHRALSMAYLNNSDFDNAQKAIDKAYDLNKQDAEILQIKSQLKNYGYKEMAKAGTESNRYIRESLAINPELIIAKWSLAHSYSTIGDNDNALREYMEILKINPKHAPALHGIALIYYNRKDYKNSEIYALQTVEADPWTAQHHYTLGLAYYQQSVWKTAEGHFKDAIRLNPEYVDAIVNIGLCYYQQGDYKTAMTEFKKAATKKPSAANFYNLGLSYYQLKRYSEAINYFEQATAYDPKYINAWYSIANSYWYQGIWDKAYQYYNKVLELDPNNAEAIKWRDDSYQKMNK